MDILVVLALIVLGYFAGGRAERSHFARLAIEERMLVDIPHSNLKKFSKGLAGEVQLVHSSVVISQDYFKMIMGSLVNLFGGRIHAYEALMDRARREAIVRVKKQARDMGATAIYNLRLETSSISQGSTNKQLGTVEVIAYATAFKQNHAEL